MIELIPIIIILLLEAFYVWMFWDFTNNVSVRTYTKFYWVLILVFLNVFGAGLYYFLKYRDR
jgi:hypothetical protein